MTGVIDTLPCGVLVVDPQGKVRAVNRTLAEALGHEPGTIEGGAVEGYLAAGSRIYYQTHLLPLLRLKGEVHEVYLSLRTASGAELPVLLNARHRRREGQTLTEVVVVPIERRNQFEDELLKARRAAEAASASRARFLSMLSHDIRSPLSAMVLSADLVARGALGPVTEEQGAELGRVAEAGRYVLRLVTDVLDFSRLESGRVDVRLRPVGLAGAVARALEIVGADARAAGVDLGPPTGPADAHAQADPDRLQQVLLNLLTNAVKFTGAGGRVRASWVVEGGDAVVRVSDTGPGIAPEAMERLFAPFVQGAAGARGGAAGVGLGLAISRELTRAMGGDLTVESVEGEGATFLVRLVSAPAEVD